jgi:phosphoserine phosphatase
VEAWLARRQLPRLSDCAFSTFYSDSASDLPLLQAVQRPVAVRPDERLQRVAAERGWPVLPLA